MVIFPFFKNLNSFLEIVEDKYPGTIFLFALFHPQVKYLSQTINS